MLKILILDSSNRRRVVLEGKLVAPWAAELITACDNARADLRGRDLVLDLNNLMAISQDGENALAALAHQGVKFRRAGVLAKQVFRQLARRSANTPDANRRKKFMDTEVNIHPKLQH